MQYSTGNFLVLHWQKAGKLAFSTIFAPFFAITAKASSMLLQHGQPHLLTHWGHSRELQCTYPVGQTLCTPSSSCSDRFGDDVVVAYVYGSFSSAPTMVCKSLAASFTVRAIAPTVSSRSLTGTTKYRDVGPIVGLIASAARANDATSCLNRVKTLLVG